MKENTTDALGEQRRGWRLRKLMRESKLKDSHIEHLIYQVADYYFMTEMTRPQIDENAMALLDEIAALGYESEVREAIGGYTNE